MIHEIIGGAKTVAWVEEAHYHYREAPNSITTSKFSLKRLDAAKSKEQRIEWFESHGMHDLADRTRISYLGNLMWLYRMMRMEVKTPEANQICDRIHDRFCTICTQNLIGGESLKFKLRCRLFRSIPQVFSTVEYYRLKE